MARFLELVRTLDDREAFAELQRSGAVDAYRAFFAPHMLAFTAAAEDLVRARLLAAGADRRAIGPLLRSNPWGAYRGTEETAAALDLSACRSLVMIGCGSLPDTLLYLHEHTEIETLVGIERDPRAADHARELAENLGCDRIEIAAGDGIEADYAGFDVICPSVFARPRLEIVERIAGTASAHAQVILRDPTFTGKLLFEGVLGSLPDRLEVRAEARSRPGRLMLNRHVLGLRPRASGAAA